MRSAGDGLWHSRLNAAFGHHLVEIKQNQPVIEIPPDTRQYYRAVECRPLHVVQLWTLAEPYTELR
jgi:hypothetical protein